MKYTGHFGEAPIPQGINKILHCLASGEVVSEYNLAQRAGICRLAICQQIDYLRRAGVVIQSIKDRGYQIVGGLSLLNQRTIEQQTRIPVTLLQQTPSTNDWLRERLPSLSAPCVCLAERQLSGRGTYARQWQSPLAANLYISIYYLFQKTPAQLAGLAIALAVSVAKDLQNCSNRPIQIKWPNDLCIQNRKLGGILIDMLTKTGHSSDVIIGLGINIGMPVGWRAQINQPVADLSDETDLPLDRNALAIRVIHALIKACQQFSQSGLACFVQDWQRYDMTAKKQVKFITHNKQITGKVLGITDQGMIKIQTGHGVECFASGKLSLMV